MRNLFKNLCPVLTHIPCGHVKMDIHKNCFTKFTIFQYILLLSVIWHIHKNSKLGQSPQTMFLFKCTVHRLIRPTEADDVDDDIRNALQFNYTILSVNYTLIIFINRLVIRTLQKKNRLLLLLF